VTASAGARTRDRMSRIVCVPVFCGDGEGREGGEGAVERVLLHLLQCSPAVDLLLVCCLLLVATYSVRAATHCFGTPPLGAGIKTTLFLKVSPVASHRLLD